MSELIGIHTKSYYSGTSKLMKLKKTIEKRLVGIEICHDVETVDILKLVWTEHS